ncbi:MAG: type II/IV secretion system protein, partial [SAR324 cluster bacterium]|nr:type II/IV secretion system protein [SAR324 cluster bacterium]
MTQSFSNNGNKLALVKLLHKLGLIQPEVFPQVLASKDLNPISFCARNNLLDEASTIEKVAAALGIKVQELAKSSYNEVFNLLGNSLLATVPLARWTEMRAIPVALTETQVVIAMANPLDHESISGLSFDLGRKVEALIAKEDEILNILGMKQNAERSEDLQALFDEEHVNERNESSDTDLIKADHTDAPVIRLVNKILSQSIEMNASDIHLNPESDSLNIRARVDGIMRSLFKVPKNSKEAVVSRIKLLGGMDISERRKPQDGRLRVQSTFGNKDLRLSSVPTAHGENIVIRILSTELPLLSFDMLGMGDQIKDLLRSSLLSSSRIILVTGPTGSGKTSTLYSSLSFLNDGSKNIITVEDPIEYRIGGISQIQVNSKVGLGFAEGLRSILRQDPDIIMVGEIRDHETADIAVQAAQTGHLVLSTIHTNSAASAVTRLRDLGIPPFLISSSLGCVISQRLVRKLCPHCAYREASEEFIDFEIPGLNPNALMKAKGCEECSNTGFRGRLGIFSILPLDK